MLGYLFPADAQSLTDQATDAGMSTFYAGIHTMFNVRQGLALGAGVDRVLVGHAGKVGSQ